MEPPRITHYTSRPWWSLRPWREHSLVLLVAGVVYMIIGISMFTSVATGNRTVALQFALAWWGWHVWGAIWIAAGLLAVVSTRWPRISESWGYAVLTGLSTGWAAMYLAGMWPGNAPPSNWAGFFSWGLTAFLWWAISRLTNPYVEDESWTRP